MRPLLFLPLFFFVSQHMLAGHAPVWFSGSVVLRSSEVLQGEIAMENAHHMILLRTHGEVNVYPAHKLQAVYFYDERSNINRKFITLDPVPGAVGMKCEIYEVVIFGEVSVLRKPRSENAGDDAAGYHYFVQNDKRMIPLRKFASKLYPALVSDGGDKIETFVHEHHLHPYNPSDAIRIIEFYNLQRASPDRPALARHE